jgi:rhamnosyltransferase
MGEVTNENVAGIIVTYNPDASYFSAVINNALHQVSHLVIIDNNSSNFSEILSQCDGPKFTIIRLEKNLGTEGAYNIVVDKLKLDPRNAWVIFPDQDTLLEFNYIQSLLESYNNSKIPVDDVWVLRGLERYRGKNKPIRRRNQFEIVKTAIMSGSVVKMECLNKIRLREEFFLDHVDTDFYNKIRESGHCALRFNDVTMMHSLGETIDFQGRPTTYHKSSSNYLATRNAVVLFLEGGLESKLVWFT